MGTLKPKNNRPLYNNTVIGTLTVDGWAGTAMSTNFTLFDVPLDSKGSFCFLLARYLSLTSLHSGQPVHQQSTSSTP